MGCEACGRWRRAVPLLVVFSTWIGAAMGAGDDSPKAGAPGVRSADVSHDATRELIARTAQRFRMVGPGDRALRLEPEPALRWPNATRNTPDGATFVWTLDGRPEVIGCIWQHGSLSWALHSLSDRPVRAELDGTLIWEPKSPGVELRPLEGAPRPAKTATGRLSQMRALARRFHCRLDGENGTNVEDLRLLPQPIHRYASDDGQIVAGGLFAFAQGTDPEVIVMIEAAGAPNASWRYAISRRSVVALEARLDDRLVWSAPSSGGARNAPWFQSSLGR